jgi:hypothetical protein
MTFRVHWDLSSEGPKPGLVTRSGVHWTPDPRSGLYMGDESWPSAKCRSGGPERAHRTPLATGITASRSTGRRAVIQRGLRRLRPGHSRCTIGSTACLCSTHLGMNVRSCRDPRFRLSQITWRTSGRFQAVCARSSVSFYAGGALLGKAALRASALRWRGQGRAGLARR